KLSPGIRPFYRDIQVQGVGLPEQTVNVFHAVSEERVEFCGILGLMVIAVPPEPVAPLGYEHLAVRLLHSRILPYPALAEARKILPGHQADQDNGHHGKAAGIGKGIVYASKPPEKVLRGMLRFPPGISESDQVREAVIAEEEARPPIAFPPAVNRVLLLSRQI